MYNTLKAIAVNEGARLFGAAELKPPRNNLTRAISIGWPLSASVLETIKDYPTKIYYHHYRQVNQALDQLALKLASVIQDEGYEALPIPASQIIDWQKQQGEVSHKALGQAAGLGWLGRNNLLINELYRAQFRLVTILTSYPLPVDKPVDKDCGDCLACLEACPVGAIKENQADFNHQACFEKLKEFQKKGLVGQYICGICVKVCRRKKT